MSPKDVALKLADAAAPITGAGSQTAVLTEGGFRADVRITLGTITDADETLDMNIQASIDGGSNYFPIGFFNRVLATYDNREFTRTVYVPRPAAGQTHTRVRLTASAVAGTTPSFPVTGWLEPLVSLAVPGGEDNQSSTLNRGLAALIP